MDLKHFKEIESNDEVRKNLAKWIAHFCFRNNTPLEKFHDRFTQDEIKAISKASVDNVYHFLTTILFHSGDSTNNVIDLLKDKKNLTMQDWNKWDDPEFREDIHQASLSLLKTLRQQDKEIT